MLFEFKEFPLDFGILFLFIAQESHMGSRAECHFLLFGVTAALSPGTRNNQSWYFIKVVDPWNCLREVAIVGFYAKQYPSGIVGMVLREEPRNNLGQGIHI